MLIGRSFVAWITCCRARGRFHPSCEPPPSVFAVVLSTWTASSTHATPRTRRVSRCTESWGTSVGSPRCCNVSPTARPSVASSTGHALCSPSRKTLAAGRFPYIEIANITVLGRVTINSGEVGTGVDLLWKAADMAAEVGWHWWRAGALASLALVDVDRGNLDAAERNSKESLRLILQDESRRRTFVPLTVLARIELTRRDFRRAGLLWGALEAEDERSPDRIWQRVRPERAGPLLAESDAEFLSALDEGRELELWDAVAIALGDVELPQTVP